MARCCLFVLLFLSSSFGIFAQNVTLNTTTTPAPTPSSDTAWQTLEGYYSGKTLPYAILVTVIVGLLVLAAVVVVGRFAVDLLGWVSTTSVYVFSGDFSKIPKEDCSAAASASTELILESDEEDGGDV